MIFTRNLIKEIVIATAVVTAVVLFIFISNQFIRYIGAFATNQLFGSVVWKLLLIQVPLLLGLLLPLGVYIAIILVISRWYVDFEIVAWMAGGISINQVTKVCFAIGVFMALLVAVLNFWINPLLIKSQETIMQQAKTATLLQAISPGRFISFAKGRNVAYVANISTDGEHLDHIFMAKKAQTINNNDQWDIMVAASGYLHQNPANLAHYLVAVDGFRYMGEPGQGNYRIMKFAQYGVVSDAPDNTVVIKTKEQMRTITELFQLGFADPKIAAEITWRLALPLSALILIFLAVPLGRVKVRQGRFAKLLPAILLYVVYANLIIFMREGIAHSQISWWWGIWIVHATMLFIAWLLYQQQTDTKLWWKLIRRGNNATT